MGTEVTVSQQHIPMAGMATSLPGCLWAGGDPLERWAPSTRAGEMLE